MNISRTSIKKKMGVAPLRALPLPAAAPTSGGTDAAFLVKGYVPVALSNSEGAGSVLVLAWLPGAHLYKQVLGNTEPHGHSGSVTKRLTCACQRLKRICCRRSSTRTRTRSCSSFAAGKNDLKNMTMASNISALLLDQRWHFRMKCPYPSVSKSLSRQHKAEILTIFDTLPSAFPHRRTPFFLTANCARQSPGKLNPRKNDSV